MTSRLPPVVEANGLGSLTLVRAWPRTPGHALVEHRDATGRAVAGQWFARAEHASRLAQAVAGSVTASGGVVLQPAGVDHRLPGLAPLLGVPGTELLVHRPGRRAVVRRCHDGETSYVKVVRAGRLDALVSTARQLAGQADPERVRLAPLVAVDPDRGTATTAALAGTSLHELPAGRCWRRAWAATGRAIRAVHDADIDVDRTAGHSALDEAGLTRRQLDLAGAYGLLPIGGAIGRVVDEALAALVGGERGPRGALHRDLHDKQIIISDGGPPGLIDLDTIASGERALDLANLLAHLELRVVQGRRTVAEAVVAAESLLAGAAPDRATGARIPAHLGVARLRLAAVYAFRPAWHSATRRLLLIARGAVPSPLAPGD